MLQAEKKTFAIAEVAGEIIELYQPIAVKKGISFDCRADADTAGLKAEGDVHKLKQVIANLTANALKFTSSGLIKIFFTHSPVNNDRIELKVSVADSGTGIEKERISKLLDTSFYEGTGLNISLRLAQILGGKLTANSEPGKGSEFILTIPCGFIDIKKPDNDFAQPGFLKRTKDQMKVLLVDDDEMSRMVMGNVLNNHQIPVEIAIDGEEALQRLSKEYFDLVITDINMPGFDGPELLEKIRLGHSINKDLPVVAVTSGKSNIAIHEAQGFTKVLIKPYSEEELIKVVYECLGYKEASMDRSQKIKDNPHVSMSNPLSFNVEQLVRISNGNSEFVNNMLGKFVVTASGNSEKMLSALLEGDSAMLKHIAHKSIPSYHMLGLSEMANMLQMIEKNLRDEVPLSKCSGLVAAIHRRTKDVVNDIKKYLEAAQKNVHKTVKKE